MKPMKVIWIAFLIGIVSLPLNTYGKEDVRQREYAIKAAFIYNFAKFIEWPEEDTRASIVFCILGKDPFGDMVLSTFEGKNVRGKKFRIRKISTLNSAKECQMLYVSNSESYRLRRVLSIINQKKLPVVTIGDNDRFIEYGGMINLYRYQNRIRFEINNNLAVSKGIKISAKLLRLSKPKKRKR